MSHYPENPALAHKVENQLVRTSEYFARLDRSPAARAASRRLRSRGVASAAQRLTNVGLALAVLIAGTIVAGLLMDGIGMTGLFIVAALMMLAVLLFGRGKISALMGDVAKGIKSFKRGMAEDETTEPARVEHARARADEFGARAAEALQEVPAGDARESLLAAVRYVVERRR